MIRYEGGKDIPLILIDEKALKVFVKGPSYPPNAFMVYEPLFNWLDTLPFDREIEISIDFFYSYLNSSSKSVLLELFKRFEDFSRKNAKVSISWLFFEDDEDMEEIGQEFQEMFKLPIHIIPQNME